MNIFSVLTLIGGLAFFLYGMNVMSGSLEKMAGGKLELLLKKMTANPFVSLALGTIITMAIQSSSATTVMIVGLVNSGIMELLPDPPRHLRRQHRHHHHRVDPESGRHRE